MILCDEMHVDQVRRRLSDCVRLLEHYDWLINSFVLDFFLDSHWSHLPASWEPVLTSITPEDLAAWLDPQATPTYKTVWPLSLLALKQTIKALTLDRNPVEDLHILRQFISDQQKSTQPPPPPPTSAGLRDSTNTQNCDLDNAQRVNDNSNSNAVSDQTGSNGSLAAVSDNTDTSGSATPAHVEPLDPWKFEAELLSEKGGSYYVGLKHVFRKHVKPKKQYEMCRLAKLISSLGDSQGVGKFLDVGAGVGHLSRYLCYKHSMQVACVDGDGKLTTSACKFDNELVVTVAKMASRGDIDMQLPRAPVHVTAHLAPDMDLDKFHKILADKFSLGPREELRYGLVGLHTCGDLGPVILNMFTQDVDASLVVSVGCCYMKLKEHFPMSRFLATTQWPGLQYVSMELACHAVETYTQRLREKQENEKLKVHCYRALLEKLLVSRSPQYRHTILSTVRRAHTLPWEEYVAKATRKLVAEGGLQAFTEAELGQPDIETQLGRWWEIVTFYTLRLAMAPVIETVVLLDRLVFLHESGHRSIMLPLFDPLKSPRNQVIVAVKNT